MQVEASVTERVLRKIDDNRIESIRFLQDLVKAPSITGHEGPCSEVCLKKLKDMRLNVDAWDAEVEKLRNHPAYNDVVKYPPADFPIDYAGRPIVVGVFGGTSKGRSIIMNGHMDVVTPEPISKWRHDPWGGQVEDGKLYGRGSQDMKGGIAAMIMALKAIIDCGIELKGDAVIECVIEEEAGVGNGTLASLLRGYKADACIVTESTDLQLCRSMRGGMYWRITVEGKPSHGVEKWKGRDAIELGIWMHGALKKLESKLSAQASHPLYNYAPISIPITPDKMHAGKWKGMIAPECSIEGYFETLPGKSIEDWEVIFRKGIEELCSEDSWLKEHPPRFLVTEKYQPYELSKSDSFLQTIGDARRRILGTDQEVDVGTNGGCDATIRANYGGSSTVVFGPGGDNAHGFDEYVLLDDVIKCEKVIAQTILAWCGYSA
jgi:acetylornithine deacetylase